MENPQKPPDLNSGKYPLGKKNPLHQSVLEQSRLLPNSLEVRRGRASTPDQQRASEEARKGVRRREMRKISSKKAHLPRKRGSEPAFISGSRERNKLKVKEKMYFLGSGTQGIESF